MSRRSGRARGSYWLVDFIQPSFPDSDECIMLYGQQGEIVGPLTMELADAWISLFDPDRLNSEGESHSAPAIGQSANSTLRASVRSGRL